LSEAEFGQVGQVGQVISTPLRLDLYRYMQYVVIMQYIVTCSILLHSIPLQVEFKLYSVYCLVRKGSCMIQRSNLKAMQIMSL